MTSPGIEITIFLVKLQRRRGDMVKNGQKLKKGSFSIIKTLTLEMSPIGMKQETRKKNWNKWRRGGNRQKTTFFWRFFRKSWKFLSEKYGWWKKKLQKWPFFGYFLFFLKIMKIPKRKMRLMTKRNYKNYAFLVIFRKNDRTGFFIGNGLIEAKNWWSSL